MSDLPPTAPAVEPTAGGGDGAGPSARRVSFGEALRFWTKLGFINFGGPAGQIAIMHEEIVDRRKWVSNARFLHALNFCMLLPGPEAQQLATYVGWLMHGIRGGLIAGALFVLPGLVAIMALSWLYFLYGWTQAIGQVYHMPIEADLFERLARIAQETAR